MRNELQWVLVDESSKRFRRSWQFWSNSRPGFAFLQSILRDQNLQFLAPCCHQAIYLQVWGLSREYESCGDNANPHKFPWLFHSALSIEILFIEKLCGMEQLQWSCPTCMIKNKSKNIVWSIGYCVDSQGKTKIQKKANDCSALHAYLGESTCLCNKFKMHGSACREHYQIIKEFARVYIIFIRVILFA